MVKNSQLFQEENRNADAIWQGKLLNGLSTEEVKKYAEVTDQEIQKAKELS